MARARIWVAPGAIALTMPVYVARCPAAMARFALALALVPLSSGRLEAVAADAIPDGTWTQTRPAGSSTETSAVRVSEALTTTVSLAV